MVQRKANFHRRGNICIREGQTFSGRADGVGRAWVGASGKWTGWAGFGTGRSVGRLGRGQTVGPGGWNRVKTEVARVGQTGVKAGGRTRGGRTVGQADPAGRSSDGSSRWYPRCWPRFVSAAPRYTQHGQPTRQIASAPSRAYRIGRTEGEDTFVVGGLEG